jgi:hypothetical protein
MRKIMVAVVGVLALLAVAGTASAHEHWGWRGGYGYYGRPYFGVRIAPPVPYVAPPVYAAPVPRVYVAPPYGYYSSYPRYYQPYWNRYHHHYWYR